MSRLLDLEPVSNWTGSRDLVPASQVACSWCGQVSEMFYVQPALFRHGGYGEAQRWQVRSCHCGAISSYTRISLNPRDL